MRLLRAALAAVLICWALPAAAQDPRGKPITAGASTLPAYAIYCDDGTNHAVLCSFAGGGGGGGGTSSSISHNPYVATASGTGYSAGDVIDRVVVSDPSTGNVTASFWVDLTTGAKLSTAPAYANLAFPSVGNTAFGANCLVVSGNQAYTAGQQAQCTMTASGRLKVGLSSAGNVDPAAQLATTLDADIVACKYRATPATWSDLWTGAIRCDNSGALVVTSQAGLGTMAAVPAGSTNGTALGTLPTGATGARFYLGASDSITFTIASTTPGSAPTATFTISGASTGTGPNWDENLAGGQMIYITAKTGSPVFRWY